MSASGSTTPTPSGHPTSRGVALSVTSTTLFAGLYFYATLLRPLTGIEIFGWRMLLTLPCVTLFLMLTGQWGRVVDVFARIQRKPALILGLMASSALLGVQLWLFLWAPLNGAALQVSLGYFLLPLSMLAVGRWLYGDRLSALQTAAALAAAFGVGHEILRIGMPSWQALLVAIGLPVYFVLRRKLRTDHLGGLWFDMAFTVPVAAWCVMGQGDVAHAFAEAPRLFVLIPLLAVISAAAFMCYTVSSRLLSFSLFGLLGYVEPVLMLVVSLILGERVQPDEWLTYLPIWGAVVLLVVDGALHVARTAAGRG